MIYYYCRLVILQPESRLVSFFWGTSVRLGAVYLAIGLVLLLALSPGCLAQDPGCRSHPDTRHARCNSMRAKFNRARPNSVKLSLDSPHLTSAQSCSVLKTNPDSGTSSMRGVIIKVPSLIGSPITILGYKIPGGCRGFLSSGQRWISLVDLHVLLADHHCSNFR